MKGLRVLGYSCESNVVRRGSKRDTGDMYDINSCTFLLSGLPFIVRSFKGKEVSLGQKDRPKSRIARAFSQERVLEKDR